MFFLGQFPESLGQQVDTSFPFSYYHENEMLQVPYPKESSQMDIEVELASRLQYATLKEGGIDVSRLEGGELVVEQGRYRLSVASQSCILEESM